MNQDRRDAAFDRAVARVEVIPTTVYWLLVRFYPNGEAKRLEFGSAMERGLASISLGATGAEIIRQGEGEQHGD